MCDVHLNVTSASVWRLLPCDVHLRVTSTSVCLGASLYLLQWELITNIYSSRVSWSSFGTHFEQCLTGRNAFRTVRFLLGIGTPSNESPELYEAEEWSFTSLIMWSNSEAPELYEVEWSFTSLIMLSNSEAPEPYEAVRPHLPPGTPGLVSICFISESSLVLSTLNEI